MMTANTAMSAAPLEIDDLVSGNTSHPGRHTLVRNLADLVVLSQSKLSNNERDFIADILIRSLEQVDASIRQEIANRIAGFTDVPVQLQQSLLTDEISVAKPLLEQLSHVPEALLLQVSQLGYEYRDLISHRDHLPQVVTDHLVTCGETDLIIRLLKREDVEFSCASMDTLVGRSEFDEAIRAPLSRREELRIEHGLRMFWWLKTPLRKHILSRFATNRALIQEAMHELFVETYTSETPDPHVLKILQLIDRRHRPRGPNGEAVTMDIVERTLKLARLNPSDEFADAVGLLAGVSSATAGKALRDFSGEAFAILCKSIGLSRKAFTELFVVEADQQDTAPKYSEEKLEDLLGIFDSIARDYSRTILRYWDWRQDFYMPADSDLSTHQADQEDNNSTYLGAI